MGMRSYLVHILNASQIQVVHPEQNCGNTNWGVHCLDGWLGSQPERWDFVSLNFGQHDLALDNQV
jgi:hypothetical protein